MNFQKYNPTLIMTGTDDGTMAPANSLIIAGKIPGDWIVQIRCRSCSNGSIS